MRYSRVALFFILLYALCLRLPGLGYQLPYLGYGDDHELANVTWQMLRNETLNPHYLNYPSLSFYIAALSTYIYLKFAFFFGFINSDFVIPQVDAIAGGIGRLPYPNLLLLQRLISAFIGVISVGIAYLCGARARNSSVGLISALLLAISPTSVQFSQMIGPHIYLQLCGLLVLFFSQNLTLQNWKRQILWAGLCLGLGTSAKYNAIFAGIIPLAAMCLLVVTLETQRLRVKILAVSLILLGASTIFGFFVGTPYAFINLHELVTDVIFHWSYYSHGHPAMEGHTFTTYMYMIFWYDLPQLLLASCGLILLLKYRTSLLYLAFPLSYFLFLCCFTFSPPQSLLLILGNLSVLAAIGSYEAYRSIVKVHFGRPLSVGLLLTLFICIGPLSESARLTYFLYSDTSAQEKVDWAEKIIPEGSKVVVESGSTYIDTKRYQVIGLYELGEKPARWYRENRVDYVIHGEWMYQRLLVDPSKYHERRQGYEQFFDNFKSKIPNERLGLSIFSILNP